MSHSRTIDIREVVFVGSAGNDFDDLPQDVLSESRALISRVQNNLIPDRNKFENLGGQLRGVSELRVNGKDTNTYRIYHVLIHREVVYILDARAKKSHQGSEIPQPDIDRILARRKTANDDYKRNLSDYQRAFEKREIQRNALPNWDPLKKPRGV